MSEAALRVPSARVARKRDARAEAILDRAMEVLAERGMEELTLQTVAEASGYVPAALYRYFASKQGILAALQRRAVDRLHARFRESGGALSARTAALARPEAALAQLVGAARFYLGLPATEPHCWHLVALLLGDPRPLLPDDEAARAAPHLLGFLVDVEALFREAHASGALGRGDAELRTLAFWAALQGALMLEKARRIQPSMPSAENVGLAQVEAMLLGWGAEPRALARARRASS